VIISAGEEDNSLPRKQRMKLSIIIVEYKTPQLLLNCLESVYRFPTMDTEVIVVDNHSQDDIEERLNDKYPQVRFIQMDYNAGFARANNAGIKMAKGEAVLLLNSDTIVIDDAINRCAESLLQSDHVACGVQLLNEDDSPQISGNFAMKGGLNYLLPLPYLGVVLRKIAFKIKMKKPSIQEIKGTMDVDWVNGAFLMVKNEAIKKAGLLDEDFFLYSEEAEWCSRLKKIGSICIYGDLHVYHLQGVSANEAFASEGKGYFNLFDKKGFQIMLSMFVRIRKQFGLFWFSMMLLMHFLAIPVFFFGLFFDGLFRPKTKSYSFQQWRGYTLNCLKMLTFTGRIIANRPYFYKVL
jgi:GT2 family glycosyltransferase